MDPVTAESLKNARHYAMILEGVIGLLVMALIMVLAYIWKLREQMHSRDIDMIRRLLLRHRHDEDGKVMIPPNGL